MQLLLIFLEITLLLFVGNISGTRPKFLPPTEPNSHQDSVLPLPCDTSSIPEYTAYRTNEKITVDGHLEEYSWTSAERSNSFRDLVHGSETRYDTRAAILWDDEYLYVSYWIEEPNLQASLLDRDAPIYHDNDVELFIAGKDAYYEFEINTYGTIYEVFFIWEEAYDKVGYADLPEFDRKREQVKPFHGVGYKPHPRGPRIGYWNWDFPGLRSAVQHNGTINDDRDMDQGWTVEIALPWNGMKALTMSDERSTPPLEGDIWRMDFSRFNQEKAGKPMKDSGGWAWSPHGVWDSHVPACFTIVEFSSMVVGK